MLGFETGLFVGEYRHSLDAKGRLTIPSSWRLADVEKAGSVSFLALPNPDKHITVYGPEMIAQLKERVSKIGMANIAEQRALAQVMSRAQSLVVDKQGRINLNEALIRYAGIDKEAVLLGKVTSFSIYSAAAYSELDVFDMDTLSGALSKFGL